MEIKNNRTIYLLLLLSMAGCTSGIPGFLIPDALLIPAVKVDHVTLESHNIFFEFSSAIKMKLSLTYDGKIIKTIEPKHYSNSFKFDISGEDLYGIFEKTYISNEKKQNIFCFGLYSHYFEKEFLLNGSHCIDNPALVNYFNSRSG